MILNFYLFIVFRSEVNWKNTFELIVFAFRGNGVFLRARTRKHSGSYDGGGRACRGLRLLYHVGKHSRYFLFNKRKAATTAGGHLFDWKFGR